MRIKMSGKIAIYSNSPTTKAGEGGRSEGENVRRKKKRHSDERNTINGHGYLLRNTKRMFNRSEISRRASIIKGT